MPEAGGEGLSGDRTVLVVGADAVAERLARRLAATVETVDGGDRALERLADVDCLCTAHGLPDRSGTGLLDAARDRPEDVEAILFAVDEPGSEPEPERAVADGATAVVDPEAPATVAALANQVRAALSGTDDGESERAAVRALHETVTEFADYETPQAVYDLTVDAAERVLNLDYSVVDTVEDDRLVPRATSSQLDPAEYSPVPVEEGGLAGAAFRSGETSVVDDVRTSDVAAADTHSYRSILTVPFESGVFQAGSERVAAFDRRDRELTELLVSHASESLHRVERERELRERERFLSTLISNLPGLVYRCVNEPGWPMEFVSEGSEALTGYAPEEITGGDVTWGEDIIVEADREGLWDTVQAAIDERAPFEVTYRIRTADGETRWVWEQGRAVDYDDEVTLEGFISDITERKQREAELREQSERMEAFARILSHDLRNPLTVAGAHLAGARRAEGDAEDHLDGIADAHDRMEAIIEGVLALVRSEESVDDDTPVALETVVRDAWENVDTAEMDLATRGDLDVVFADGPLLGQVFENLFRNAREHVGATASVWVGRLDGAAGFYVADDGENLPEDLRDSAFELGASESDGGTGTGLAIVRRVVDAHDWSVSVTESEAGGARFEFRTG